MYSIWITHYEILHTKLSDGFTIKEQVDLLSEVRILFQNIREIIPQKYRRFSYKEIDKLSNEELKGILFETYSNAGDKEAYKKVNERSKRYKNKRNSSILEEGYTIQENSLVLVD